MNRIVLIAVLCVRREGNRSGVWSAAWAHIPCRCATASWECLWTSHSQLSVCLSVSREKTADRVRIRRG
jgi:hypothetical protein